MSVKLVETHTGTIHKASKEGRPVCTNRKTGLFDDYISLTPFDGKVEEVTCKNCIAKIKKYSKDK